MLVHAIAPVYAMAFAGPQGALPGPVTTGSGIVWIALDDTGRPVQPDDGCQRPCPFCLVLATPFAVPKPVAVSERHPLSGDFGRVVEADLVIQRLSIASRRARAPPLSL
jgi:hypothetical protein